MGEVPLDWGGFGAGLHHHVFRCKRFAETQGMTARSTKARGHTGLRGQAGLRTDRCARAHRAPSLVGTSVPHETPEISRDVRWRLWGPDNRRDPAGATDRRPSPGTSQHSSTLTISNPFDAVLSR